MSDAGLCASAQAAHPNLLESPARVTVFCGGYGSGKTEVAVNYALYLAGTGKKVKLADLDIVNLYFRSREVRDELTGRGVAVLVPGDPLLRADMPVIPPEVKGAVEAGESHVVLDVGGDPVGARVLAGMADVLVASEYASLFVVNSRRPQTGTAEQVVRLIEGIGAISGVAVTGLVVNSHLVEETTAALVIEGLALAHAVERVTGLPLAFAAVDETLVDEVAAVVDCRIMRLRRLMLKPWEQAGGRE